MSESGTVESVMDLIWYLRDCLEKTAANAMRQNIHELQGFRAYLHASFYEL